MSVLASFLQSLAYPVYLLLRFYGYIIFAAVIISWLDAFNILNTYNSVVCSIRETVRKLTEPYFNLFRKFIPPVGMVDFSPLIALIVLYFLQTFIPNLLIQIARSIA